MQIQTPIVQTKDLHLFYGENEALKGITLDVDANRVTALIGPSGCGKTTFLKTINRMNDLIEGVRITGKVLFEGADIYGDYEPVSYTHLRYRDYDVAGQFGPHEYAACVFGSNSNVYSPIDIATDGYAREAEVFAEMLRSGRMKQSYEDFIKPVFVLNALHRSLENGGRMEKVNSYSI